MDKTKIKKIIYCVAVPLAVGAVSGIISRKGMNGFESLKQPPLSPPGAVFPVAWTILYVLMGVASYFAFSHEHTKEAKTVGYVAYAVQLFFNFCWTPFFFVLQARLFSFVWLLILWVLVIINAVVFEKLDRKAGYLMIPYALWTTFALYLNLGVYLLNK